jgi:hypothetical protein
MRFLRTPRPLEARFWEKVIPEPNTGCWLWMGALVGNGYGLMGDSGRASKGLYAHRLSWEIHNGPIPDGLWALHKCDVRHCVNPAHLFLGTRTDNVRDMYAKGRGTSQARPEAMPRGERHGNALLTDEAVRTIRDEASAGTPCVVLASKFGVSKTTIYSVTSGRGWRHVQ